MHGIAGLQPSETSDLEMIVRIPSASHTSAYTKKRVSFHWGRRAGPLTCTYSVTNQVITRFRLQGSAACA